MLLTTFYGKWFHFFIVIKNIVRILKELTGK